MRTATIPENWQFAPENSMLARWTFPFGKAYFQGQKLLVSGRENLPPPFPRNLSPDRWHLFPLGLEPFQQIFTFLLRHGTDTLRLGGFGEFWFALQVAAIVVKQHRGGPLGCKQNRLKMGSVTQVWGETIKNMFETFWNHFVCGLHAGTFETTN